MVVCTAGEVVQVAKLAMAEPPSRQLQWMSTQAEFWRVERPPQCLLGALIHAQSRAAGFFVGGSTLQANLAPATQAPSLTQSA